jgi:succinate dehydrogenase flavin-adding protein (antitoxin of CptAB toxin-antitoxin module)
MNTLDTEQPESWADTSSIFIKLKLYIKRKKYDYQKKIHLKMLLHALVYNKTYNYDEVNIDLKIVEKVFKLCKKVDVTKFNYFFNDILTTSEDDLRFWNDGFSSVNHEIKTVCEKYGKSFFKYKQLVNALDSDLKKTILNVTYKSHVRPKSNGKDAYTLEYLLTQNDENLYNWSYSMSKTSKQVEQLNTQLETIRRFYEQHDVTFYNMLYDVFESCEHWNHIGRLTELKENYK